MKRTLSIVIAIVALVLAVSCGSSQPAPAPASQSIAGSQPEWVKKARRNAPEDVLVGVGDAKMATVSMSRTQSENRARVEISRQMNSIVENQIRDYQAGSEVDLSAAVAFQQNFSSSLSRSELVGARIVEQDTDENGICWTVIYLSKSDAVREINQAQALAKLAVPAMAAFDAERQMQEAFDRIARMERGE